MKKVVYATDGICDDSVLLPTTMIHELEKLGWDVVLRIDGKRQEPKVERCRVYEHDYGAGRCLNFVRIGDEHAWSISYAISDPAFAGFEFEDEGISDRPWRKSASATKNCSFVGYPDVSKIHVDEHAKYVLFRRGE